MEESVSVYDEIREERARQDAKRGGPSNDDERRADDWTFLIEDKLCDADNADVDSEYRQHMIEIAALAVAAVEWLDRHTSRNGGA